MIFSKISLALTLIFFLSSCSKVDSIYSSLHENKNSTYLIGIGSSLNLNESKLFALNDLVSQISLDISSSLNLESKLLDSKSSKKIDSNIKINVNNITLDGVEFSINEANGIFFVKASIEKKKVINFLNELINEYISLAFEVVNEIKASNCSSILPKQKNTLQDLLNKISSANRKIIALDGVENLTPSIIKEFYSLPLAAYYESTNIDNVINKVLMGEYSKFFDISTKNKNIYKIHSFYSKDSSNRIDFRTNIIDCNGNTVFSAKIDNESSIDRLKVRLYKSLLDYSLNQSY